MPDYSKLLQRKRCQDVLNGKTAEWDYRTRLKLRKLKEQQTKLFFKENWEGWAKMQKVIEGLKEKLEENLNLEIMVYKWKEGKSK